MKKIDVAKFMVFISSLLALAGCDRFINPRWEEQERDRERERRWREQQEQLQQQQQSTPYYQGGGGYYEGEYSRGGRGGYRSGGSCRWRGTGGGRSHSYHSMNEEMKENRKGVAKRIVEGE